MGNLANMTHLSSASTLGHPHPLILIDGSEESQWSLQYALRQYQAGIAKEITLVCVVTPVRHWEVLKFRTEEEVRQHFLARSSIFLDDASARLETEHAPHRTLIRESDDRASCLLSLAEELACGEIVLPHEGWRSCLPGSLTRQLRQHARGISIVTVEAQGVATR